MSLLSIYLKNLSRNKRSVFTADFFVADCSEVILQQVFPRNASYDLVSCQFALHYAFESINQARRILSNISSLLRENGVFIATIPNAYEIVRRSNEALNIHAQNSASQSHAEEIRFGNPVYSVTFPATSFSVRKQRNQTNDAIEVTFPLFGAKYNFFLDGVVDCPEFVVYPPLLDKLAADYKLVPIQRPISFAKNFYNTLCSRSSPQNPKDLLKRMEALETWHINHDYSCSNNAEYSHLIDHQNNSHKDGYSFGTLSKSDWEVTSMYSLVAYQKKSNTV
ncbi:mRNA cap guanine-N7 methyltransferase isoform 1 [Schistosoma japonicum]|uniref:mRNA (guanine-N(7))-methyltransferase n=1 Tax=Schistosoma japonicum TaxID=6182 RepID=A0A4Z2D9I5_SCHJA|nr:mRNA cap guanine-N7 methyltransferase [Schistosoma japonicum]TNN13172.1 mRNA cap guanine-N7 methyltransferase isoform 1 [Schistosoma japonicum]